MKVPFLYRALKNVSKLVSQMEILPESEISQFSDEHCGSALQQKKTPSRLLYQNNPLHYKIIDSWDPSNMKKWGLDVSRPWTIKTRRSFMLPIYDDLYLFSYNKICNDSSCEENRHPFARSHHSHDEDLTFLQMNKKQHDTYSRTVSIYERSREYSFDDYETKGIHFLSISLFLFVLVFSLSVFLPLPLWLAFVGFVLSGMIFIGMFIPITAFGLSKKILSKEIPPSTSECTTKLDLFFEEALAIVYYDSTHNKTQDADLVDKFYTLLESRTRKEEQERSKIQASRTIQELHQDNPFHDQIMYSSEVNTFEYKDAVERLEKAEEEFKSEARRWLKENEFNKDLGNSLEYLKLRDN